MVRARAAYHIVMARRELGRLRIIAGTHRSRLIDFDAGAGVRPTPDRVRQTLFDWLSPYIDGARVLDLFAGSGALGFEAASRGAAQVSFVERGRGAAQAIRTAAAQLGLDHARVHEQDAVSWLAATTEIFDVVFLDPPYDSDLLARSLERLTRVLAPHALVYLEWPTGRPPVLPAGLVPYREKQAGRVCFALMKHTVISP